MDPNAEAKPPNEEATGAETEIDNQAGDSLDGPSGGSAPEDGASLDQAEAGGDGSESPPPKPPAKPSRLKRLFGGFNLYLLLFGLVILVALGIVAGAYMFNKKSNGNSPSVQNLSDSALEQLASSDATVGNSNQILNVQSSAVFAGRVLIREGLDVAGNLELGGTLALNDLAVAGTAQFGQAQVNKDLSVAGNAGIQGSATIAKSLQVNGGGSFSGPVTAPQITTGNLQLNGDLVLTHHVIAGGATPSRANGSALGSGGTASVSGSDSAGSITINTGSSPPAGCFVTVNFVNRYSATPHVLITPVGSTAGGLAYYVNRGQTNFSVCDASAPPGSASFGFDYFVVD